MRVYHSRRKHLEIDHNFGKEMNEENCVLFMFQLEIKLLTFLQEDLALVILVQLLPLE